VPNERENWRAKGVLCEETADTLRLVCQKSVTGQRSNQLNYVPNLFSYLYRKPACLVAFLRFNRFACVACFNLVEPNSEVNGHHGHQAPTVVQESVLQATRTQSSCPCPVNELLIFDQPQRLKYIFLVFEENETGRAEEFVLRWSPNGESSLKEIVRQQWNFSPPDSTREVEEYRVDLSNVTVLELVINPNIGGGVGKISTLESGQY
jgi:hypothetical protein